MENPVFFGKTSGEIQASKTELFPFAKNKNISGAIALAQDYMTQLLHLPVSEVAYAQLQNMIHNADQI